MVLIERIIAGSWAIAQFEPLNEKGIGWLGGGLITVPGEQSGHLLNRISANEVECHEQE